ncbi:hypothetical protein V5799_020723 [Amblyomma americanum]|uniref:Uncharacterized protein n=1 Tax=Amblyomma americanum TaxID=6943 RepID=A0AAQ4ET63_AMBAM
MAGRRGLSEGRSESAISHLVQDKRKEDEPVRRTECRPGRRSRLIRAQPGGWARPQSGTRPGSPGIRAPSAVAQRCAQVGAPVRPKGYTQNKGHSVAAASDAPHALHESGGTVYVVEM